MTATKPLSVKILGSGNAAKKHQAAFAKLPELYQIVDSDSPDIIDICTPPYLHFPQAKQALLSGSHAIVEKPVAGSLAECDELRELEQQTGKKLCPVFQYRFAGHDPVQTDVITHWQRSGAYYCGWRGNWRKSLGGTLITHAVHGLDLVLMSKKILPIAVDCTLEFTPSLQTQTDTLALMTLRWPPDAAIGHHVGSLVSPRSLPERRFRLGDSFTGYVNQFHLLHKALTLQAEMPVSLSQARQVLEVVTAAYYSAFTRWDAPIINPVTLPIPPEHPFYHGWAKAFAQRASQPDTRSPAFQKTP